MSSGMLRTEAVEVLAGVRGDMLSVVTMRALEPWFRLGQCDERNFDVSGCMGSASSIALGLAIARPRDRVLVIDGDGSLLMQLASLVSIAEHAPSNLCYVVMENGVYETSGNQPVPGRDRADLRAIALAAGFRHSFRYESLAQLREDGPEAVQLTGPVFIGLAISGPGVIPADWPMPEVVDKPTQVENMRRALAAT